MDILAYLLAAHFGLASYGIDDLQGFKHDTGRLSAYKPKDGHHNELLACGGKITWKSNHIAYRRWWKVGCRRRVLVCASATRRCVWSKVMDGGPYGAYRGALRRCVQEGRYRVASRVERRRGRLRPGWKWRGHADLSFALWESLGRPRFLSGVQLYFPPKGWRKRQPKKMVKAPVVQTSVRGWRPGAEQSIASWSPPVSSPLAAELDLLPTW